MAIEQAATFCNLYFYFPIEEVCIRYYGAKLLLFP